MKIEEINTWYDDDNTRRFRWYERGQEKLKPIYYWSYGMLCDPDNMEYPDAKMIGRAVLKGFKLELLSHANVIPSNSKVWGTLWSINFNTLKQLDMVEGYPEYYTRIVQPVQTDDGKTYQAQIYVMTTESRTRLLKNGPGERYVRSIARGYAHSGIPQKQLYDAIESYHNRMKTFKNQDTTD